jgi:uncharacterized damage-inducible protein DinB
VLVPVVPRPAADEFAEFYAGYIAEVPAKADPIEQLAAQAESTQRLFAAIPEEAAAFRYAPEKWSVKELVGHLCDSERIFAYRLLRIARGDETPLAGFEENEYVNEANFDARAFADLAAEWLAIRGATLPLVAGIAAGAWERRGTANGKPISARALLYIIIGHTQHHLGVLRTRYRVGTSN